MNRASRFKKVAGDGSSPIDVRAVVYGIPRLGLRRNVAPLLPPSSSLLLEPTLSRTVDGVPTDVVRPPSSLLRFPSVLAVADARNTFDKNDVHKNKNNKAIKGC